MCDTVWSRTTFSSVFMIITQVSDLMEIKEGYWKLLSWMWHCLIALYKVVVQFKHVDKKLKCVTNQTKGVKGKEGWWLVKMTHVYCTFTQGSYTF